MRDLKRLQNSLATADEPLIAKVVALIDALETRGAADAVIAPLRPRLAQLRPRRPLRFCRLLFMPLDPLIVPAPAWRLDSPTIPRTALAPLADTVRAAMPHEAGSIDAAIRHCDAQDCDVARSAGSHLWPHAAGILAAASRVAGWDNSGLPADACLPLTRRIATLLAQIAPLQVVFAEAEAGVTLHIESLLPIIAGAAAAGSECLAMAVALLLARLPEARGMLGDAAHVLGPPGVTLIRVATGRAIEVLVDRLYAPNGVETLVVGSSLAEAGAEVSRLIQLLRGMTAGASGPECLPRLTNVLQRLDASCRLRFATALEADFVEPLRRLAEPAGPAALLRLEAAARGLHALQQEGCRIGSPEIYQMLLQQTASLVKTAGSRQALGLVDRVRLVEILAGSDAAMAMLE